MENKNIARGTKSIDEGPGAEHLIAMWCRSVEYADSSDRALIGGVLKQ